MAKRTDNLISSLRGIAQLGKQVEQVIRVNSEVQGTHPDRLREAERWLQLASVGIKLVREEVEISVGHWQEVREAMPLLLDRFSNVMLMVESFDFLDATDKGRLKVIVQQVLQYSPELFQEILGELGEEERLALLGRYHG